MGDIVVLTEPGGCTLGTGIWDPASPIAVRVFSTEPSEPLTVDLVGRRLERAFARRDRWFADGTTNAYRLCHGEGDRVPGVVVDRYDRIAVVRTDGEGAAAWLGRVVRLITPLLQERGVETLLHRVVRREGEAQAQGASVASPGNPRAEVLFGPTPPPEVTVLECGAKMVVDLWRGQKTGAFLDQRENRERVRRMASGRRVLNLFSYTGGFSTAAVLGGAEHVTSVDLAHAAHATAQSSMRANGIDPARHAFVTADAFAFLEGARRRKQSWDLILSDPPSFAPSERALQRALSAYRKLHAAAAGVLEAGGTLCAASCSSHVHARDFLTTLDDATLGRRDLSVASIFGTPPDHPIVAGWPEGQYLKFVVLV